MKSQFKHIALLLLFQAIALFSNAQGYKINDIYGVDIWGSIEESFDPINSKFAVKMCNSGLTVSISPQKPRNASKYSLYTIDNQHVKNTNNQYQFLDLPVGNYIVKDGDLALFEIENSYVDKSNAYVIVLTNEYYEEITDFGASYLNSIELRATVKNTETNQVDSCVPYLNWKLNNTYINSINTITLHEGDTIGILIDAVELCTEGCFSYLESSFLVNSIITSFINVKEDLTIELFPNPTKDHSVITSSNIIKTVRIINTIGTEYYPQIQRLNDKSLKINLNEIPNGVYTAIITLSNESIIRRILKE